MIWDAIEWFWGVILKGLGIGQVNDPTEAARASGEAQGEAEQHVLDDQTVIKDQANVIATQERMAAVSQPDDNAVSDRLSGGSF